MGQYSKTSSGWIAGPKEQNSIWCDFKEESSMSSRRWTSVFRLLLVRVCVCVSTSCGWHDDGIRYSENELVAIRIV